MNRLLKAILKIVIFAAVTVIAGRYLMEHGAQTYRDMQRNSELDWVEVSKDLGLLFLVVCGITWMKRSWEQRHQGKSPAKQKARRKTSKIDDNIRIPK